MFGIFACCNTRTTMPPPTHQLANEEEEVEKVEKVDSRSKKLRRFRKTASQSVRRLVLEEDKPRPTPENTTVARKRGEPKSPNGQTFRMKVRSPPTSPPPATMPATIPEDRDEAFLLRESKEREEALEKNKNILRKAVKSKMSRPELNLIKTNLGKLECTAKKKNPKGWVDRYFLLQRLDRQGSAGLFYAEERETLVGASTSDSLTTADGVVRLRGVKQVECNPSAHDELVIISVKNGKEKLTHLKFSMVAKFRPKDVRDLWAQRIQNYLDFYGQF